MEALENLLKNFGIDNASLRQLFVSKAALIEFNKNKDVFLEGKISDKEYLLISGIAHRYNISENGAMITSGFYLPGAAVTPHFARTSNGRNIFSLQTLTDATLAAIPVSELDELRNTHPAFRLFGQQVVETELSSALQQEVALRSFNAKERLVAMRAKFPGLENSIPHAFIASYLGITHVSFSRLRKELSKK